MLYLDGWLRQTSALLNEFPTEDFVVIVLIFVACTSLLRAGQMLQGPQLGALLARFFDNSKGPAIKCPKTREDQSVSIKAFGGVSSKILYLIRRKHARVRRHGVGWRPFQIIIIAFILVALVNAAEPLLRWFKLHLSLQQRCLFAAALVAVTFSLCYYAERTRKAAAGGRPVVLSTLVLATWEPLALLGAAAFYPELIDIFSILL